MQTPVPITFATRLLVAALLLSAAPAAAQSEEGPAEPASTSGDALPDELSDLGEDDVDEAEGAEAPVDEDEPPPFEEPSHDGLATQPDLSEFDEIERFMGLEARRGSWELDDGLGTEEVPWDDYDRESSYLPRGLVHFGFGARVAAMPGGGNGLPAPDGPLVEASFLVDLRYTQNRPWRMRLALAVNYQPYAEENVGAGATIAQSPFAIRLRIMPLSFDIMHWVGIRVGPDIGIQWAPGAGSDGGEMTFLAGSTAEIVLNLLDGLLELGVVAGMQMTAVGRSTRSGFGSELRPEGMVGATVGYFLE